MSSRQKTVVATKVQQQEKIQDRLATATQIRRLLKLLPGSLVIEALEVEKVGDALPSAIPRNQPQ